MSTTAPTSVEIPFPTAPDLHLSLRVAACKLTLRPGKDNMWVSGTYTDPTGALPLRTAQEGGTLRISQGQSFPDFLRLFTGVPVFELALGTAQPYQLTFEAGASESELDLGGVPITRLIVKQGAGKYAIRFSSPNPQVMSLLDLDGGAGSIELGSLANANLSEMSVDGGAGNYVLDFGGTLQRDAHIRLSTGASSVELRVPASTAAKVTAESTLGSVDVGDGYMKREGAFWSSGALAGAAPTLSIRSTVALGTLRLRQT
ncbi:MAG: cell wall-active antibiotics response protein [Chloroflexota bacterium]|nr:cell wall-active antibiotics response protein [Chloroflexota bacterium]